MFMGFGQSEIHLDMLCQGQDFPVYYVAILMKHCFITIQTFDFFFVSTDACIY